MRIAKTSLYIAMLFFMLLFQSCTSTYFGANSSFADLTLERQDIVLGENIAGSGSTKRILGLFGESGLLIVGRGGNPYAIAGAHAVSDALKNSGYDTLLYPQWEYTNKNYVVYQTYTVKVTGIGVYLKRDEAGFVPPPAADIPLDE